MNVYIEKALPNVLYVVRAAIDASSYPMSPDGTDLVFDDEVLFCVGKLRFLSSRGLLCNVHDWVVLCPLDFALQP